MSDADIKLLRRAAEDAQDACNRHYGPFIDVVAHPLRILAVVDRVKAADAEIARLSAALAEKSAQLEEERARNAAMVPVAWMIQVASRTEFTTNEAKANLANNMRYVVTPLAIIPGAKP